MFGKKNQIISLNSQLKFENMENKMITMRQNPSDCVKKTL